MIILQDSIFWFSVIRFNFNKWQLLMILYIVAAFESNSFDHNSFTYNSMRINKGFQIMRKISLTHISGSPIWMNEQISIVQNVVIIFPHNGILPRKWIMIKKNITHFAWILCRLSKVFVHVIESHTIF